MNHGLTLIVSFFSFVQTSFREFGEVGEGGKGSTTVAGGRLEDQVM